VEDIRNNAKLYRYELDSDGQTAVLYYKLAPGLITFTHTETPVALRGRGIASRLVHAALQNAGAEGLKVAARCPFVASYIAKHPEFGDLLQ
jgi:uncharacterized protein